MAQGYPGHVREITPEKHDPRQAIRKLARAGYNRGFRVTIHGPNNRYIRDGQVTRAIAEMLGRVGLRASAETMARNVFFPRAAKEEFSLMLAGYSVSYPDPTLTIQAVLATPKPGNGTGQANFGRYSNRTLDDLLARAKRTMEDATREELTVQSLTSGLKDYGIIPLYIEKNGWATRKPIRITPDLNGRTQAMFIQPN